MCLGFNTFYSLEKYFYYLYVNSENYKTNSKLNKKGKSSLKYSVNKDKLETLSLFSSYMYNLFKT